MCENLTSEDTLQKDIIKRTTSSSLCKNKLPCTYVSCESMDTISIADSSLSIKCGDIKSLSKIFSIIQNNTLGILIKDLSSEEAGLEYRLERWNKFNENSLLLWDSKGYFVGSWKTNIKKKKTNILINKSEAEELASTMPNYTNYGKGYAIRGFYTIYSKNNSIILPGLLTSIPYEDTSSINIDDITYKIVGNFCFVYKKGDILLTIIPTQNTNKNSLAREINSTLRKDIQLNEWKRHYNNLLANF